MRCEYDGSIMEYDALNDEYYCKVCGNVKSADDETAFIPFISLKSFVSLPKAIKFEILAFINQYKLYGLKDLILANASLIYRQHKLKEMKAIRTAVAILVFEDIKKMLPFSIKKQLLDYAKQNFDKKDLNSIKHSYKLAKFLEKR